MNIDILTLFPDMFIGPFDTSMLKKAQDNNLVEINIHDLRKWTDDAHKTVDGKPYGGGPGMVMMVEPIDKALKELKSEARISKSGKACAFGVETISKSQIPSSKPTQKPKTKNSSTVHQPARGSTELTVEVQLGGFNSSTVILTSAKGKIFNQQKAQKLSNKKHLIIIAGHYEGVDERVAKYLVDEEISIGKYVLTGGEIPAMVMVDSVVRLIPGVLGNPNSLKDESFSLTTTHHSPFTKEHPQYTRPENYKGWKVPEILLSGNHAEIEKWRKDH
ncbi:tRNA (guanosine(37)-N1)-methyltransferase TrmD [Patescibacteria group bacterium]|nr:tRNA (guanosine(37)-N1)-methyltransferase TrmD [Patescibacteria group bacterium]